VKLAKIRNVSLKTYLLTVLLVALICIGTTSYVLSQSSSQTITIEPASFTETASYIIFRQGDTYYAKNGTTGEIEFSGTGASQVIQQSIDSLTEGIIAVRFPADTATIIDSPITLKSYITLDLGNSYLYFTDDGKIVIPNLSSRVNIEGGILRSETTSITPVIHVEYGSSGSSYVDGVTIRGCRFIGGKTGILIEVYNHVTINLEDLQFLFCADGDYSHIKILMHGYNTGYININNIILKPTAYQSTKLLTIENDGSRNIGSGGYININNFLVGGKLQYNSTAIHIYAHDGGSLNYIYFNNVMLGKPKNGVIVQVDGDGYISELHFENFMVGMEDGEECRGFYFEGDDIHSITFTDVTVDMAGATTGSIAFDLRNLKNFMAVNLKIHDQPANTYPIVLNYTKLGNNYGFKNCPMLATYQGVVTISAGNTEASVSHFIKVYNTSLVKQAPQRISISPLDDLGGLDFWVTATSTAITVHISSTDTSDHSFYVTAEG